MAALLSLLKRHVEKEGFLKKNASAKGTDEVRGNWQERWFVLSGHNLEYFKKKGDSTPKGVIDLRAAKVDDADSRTGMDFTIRIAQSKQVFNYIQCSHQQDKDDWLTALRKCAGYKMETVTTEDVAPTTQAGGFASFSVLYSHGQANPTRMIVMVDPTDNMVKIFQEGQIVKTYPCSSISFSKMDEQVARPANADRNMYKLNVDFKAEAFLTRKIFWVDSAKEAKNLETLFTDVSNGNMSPAHLAINQPVIMQDFLQLRSSADESKWDELWVVLIEAKCLAYAKKTDTVPLLVFSLVGVKIKADGKTGLTLVSNALTYVMRMVDTETRDVWHRRIYTASRTLKERLAQQTALATGASSPVGGFRSDSSDSDDDIPPPPGAASVIPEAKHAANTLSSKSFAGIGAADLREDEDSFVASWGLGEGGQLGHRSKDNLLDPAVISALNGKFVRAVAAGVSHCGIVTKAGHVFMWGEGVDCQLGLGENRKQSSTPYMLTSLRTHNITRLVCGTSHTLALSASGQVFAWGGCSRGELGLGSARMQGYPKLVESLLGVQPIDVAAGGHSSAAVCAGGSLYVWGANDHGQLGLGHNNVAAMPTKSSLVGVQTVSLGAQNAAFLLTNNKLLTCGNNSSGQLGHGNEVSLNRPKEIAFFSTQGLSVTSVAVGSHNMCALARGSESAAAPYVWGREVFNGLTVSRSEPAQLRGLPPLKFVSASATHCLLIDESLHTFAFGSNTYGELGNLQPHVTSLTQVAIQPSQQVVQAACGHGFSMCLLRGAAPDKISTGKTDTIVATESAEPSLAMDMQTLRVASGNITEQDANMKIASLLNAMAVVPPDMPVGAVVQQSVASIPEPATGPSVALPEPVAEPVAEPIAEPDTGPTPIDVPAFERVESLPEAEVEVEDEDSLSAAIQVVDIIDLSDTAKSDKKKKKKDKKEKKKKPKWKEVVDKGSGRVYYYNTATRETRWLRPDDEEMNQ